MALGNQMNRTRGLGGPAAEEEEQLGADATSTAAVSSPAAAPRGLGGATPDPTAVAAAPRTPRRPTTPGTPATPSTPAGEAPPTVQSIVGDIVNDPSNPLMQEARTRAAQQANSRGLLNSSIAVGEGERAAYAAALPIAQADSASANQRSMLTQQLSSQERVASEARKTQQALAQMSIASQEKIASSSQATQLSIAQLDKTTQEKIANMNVSQADRANAMSAAATIGTNYMDNYTSIMNNKDIPAAGRATALANLLATRDSDLAMVEQMYGLDLTWSNVTNSAQITTPPGTTPTGTTPSSPTVAAPTAGQTAAASAAMTAMGMPPSVGPMVTAPARTANNYRGLAA